MSPPPITRRWKRISGVAAAAAALAASTLLTAPAATAAPAFDGTPAYFSGMNVVNGLDHSSPYLQWNGAPAYSDDNIPGAGPSYQLDGNTTLTDPNTDVGNLGTGDFAIGLHYKTTSTADRVVLLSKQSVCDGKGPSWLQVSLANDSVYVEVVGPDSAAEFSGAKVSTRDGQWHFVELIRHNNTVHLYFDGTQIGSSPFSGPNPNNDAHLTLGGGVCVGARASWAGLTGNLSFVYLGPGSTYTLSLANNPAGPAGATGDAKFNYMNNYGTSMLATVTTPHGTTLADLNGPGCGHSSVEANQCTYNLSGHGAPITASVSVPDGATAGTTYSGGNFRMVDNALPLSPASTGWDPATASANLAYTVTVDPTAGTPIADWQIALPLLGGLALFGGGLVWFRRRRTATEAAI